MEPRTIFPGLSRMNESLYKARSWMMDFVTDNTSTLNIAHQTPSPRSESRLSIIPNQYSEALHINSYMGRLIDSCKNSTGGRWLTHFQNELLTCRSSARCLVRRRADMFYSDSDDSGISVSLSSGMTRNNSVHSSTESINTIVEQYKLQLVMDKSCNSSKTTLPFAESQNNYISTPSKTSKSLERTASTISKDSTISMQYRKLSKRDSLSSNKSSPPSFVPRHHSTQCLQPRDSTRTLPRSKSDTFQTQPCIKLSLQYFRNGNQLRTILLNSNNLTVTKESTVFTKCVLYRNKQKAKSCTQKIQSSSLQKINTEVLFENVHFKTDKCWSLTVKMYSRKNVFSRKRYIGQTHLPLSDMDLFMNKTCWCLINTGSKDNMVTAVEGEDFYVVSTDESIRAKAKASITGTALELFHMKNEESTQFSWKPKLRRADTDPYRRNRRRKKAN